MQSKDGFQHEIETEVVLGCEIEIAMLLGRVASKCGVIVGGAADDCGAANHQLKMIRKYNESHNLKFKLIQNISFLAVTQLKIERKIPA